MASSPSSKYNRRTTSTRAAQPRAVRLSQPILDEEESIICSSIQLPDITTKDAAIHPALRSNFEDTHQESTLVGSTVEGHDERLRRVRFEFIRNEMTTMLEQIYDLEKRISKIKKVLADRTHDIQTKEYKVAQREVWLRARENAVRQRETQARCKELQSEHLQSELMDAKSSANSVKSDVTSSSWRRSMQMALNIGSLQNRPVVFDDDLPGEIKVASQALQNLKSQDQTFSGSAAALDCQIPASEDQVNEVSNTNSANRSSRYAVVAPPTTPRSKSRNLIARKISPFISKTPPPPCESPQPHQSPPANKFSTSESFWKRTQIAAGKGLESILGSKKDS